MKLSMRSSVFLMAAAAVAALALLAIVAKLSRPSTKVLAQQKLWAFNMGYEHHEQPPFQTFPVRAHTAKAKAAKVQQLWGFNLGYEHHEQKPIAFGAVSPAAAKQMQLWGWNMGYEHHEHKPIPFGVKPSAAKEQPQKQQLWGFNMGYEHHEQKPMPFGVVAQPQGARPTQLAYDSEAEENMDPALGRGSDQHVMTGDGVWTKPEFKTMDEDYALHTLKGTYEAR